MFGYVTVDASKLDEQGQARYQEVYCGVCRGLKEEYGTAGRATLAHDMTFLALLLGSLYGAVETSGEQRCPIRPLKRCPYVMSEAIRYAADMNILLAYYKCLDDWQDDGNRVALAKSRLLGKNTARLAERWPRQASVVAEGLAELGAMEKANELNPDIPANCFGALMGELFILREDEWSDTLRRMGAALGRFIYIMDASNDLVADIKKERYNPLIAQSNTDFTPLLTMLIGECTMEFEKLPLGEDLPILHNILYSGVWTRYKKKGGDAS